MLVFNLLWSYKFFNYDQSLNLFIMGLLICRKYSYKLLWHMNPKVIAINTLNILIFCSILVLEHMSSCKYAILFLINYEFQPVHFDAFFVETIVRSNHLQIHVKKRNNSNGWKIMLDKNNKLHISKWIRAISCANISIIKLLV